MLKRSSKSKSGQIPTALKLKAIKRVERGEGVLPVARDMGVTRKDIGTSYRMAVVTDDHLQGITHVVRGADLEAATPIHKILQRLLGFATPHYHHHKTASGRHGLFLAVGFLLGGQTGMAVAFVVAAGMNVFTYWNADKMALRMQGARPI